MAMDPFLLISNNYLVDLALRIRTGSVNVNASNSQNGTLLYHAYYNNWNAIPVLLGLGANPNVLVKTLYMDSPGTILDAVIFDGGLDPDVNNAYHSVYKLLKSYGARVSR